MTTFVNVGFNSKTSEIMSTTRPNTNVVRGPNLSKIIPPMNVKMKRNTSFNEISAEIFTGENSNDLINGTSMTLISETFSMPYIVFPSQKCGMLNSFCSFFLKKSMTSNYWMNLFVNVIFFVARPQALTCQGRRWSAAAAHAKDPARPMVQSAFRAQGLWRKDPQIFFKTFQHCQTFSKITDIMNYQTYVFQIHVFYSILSIFLVVFEWLLVFPFLIYKSGY